ncbi:MAG: hypothetical protein AAF726_06410 [Planctomycetota bacterium]
MSTRDGDRFDAGRGGSWPHGDDLDALLGLDPSPTLSKESVRAIHEGLTDGNDEALDALLGVDVVDVPAGLANDVLARVASERRAVTRRRAMRLVPMTLVAAAAVVLLVLRGRTSVEPDQVPTLVAEAETGAGAPSDELLAALPVLEDYEFLTEDLDPLESDALFLLDDEDALLLDLIELGG